MDDIIERLRSRIDGLDLELPHAAPSALRRMGRNTRAGDMASAMIVAITPTVVRSLREHIAARRRPPARMLAIVPVMVTRRSVLAGGGVGIGIFAGLLVARVLLRRRAARRRSAKDLALEVDAVVINPDAEPKQTPFDLEAAVARMENEGGDPAVSDAVSWGKRRTSERRFARSSS